jgi:disulfide bond formation protein DsbB
MSDVLRHIFDRWRLCALLISAFMLATAHAFETFGGLAPCHLCLLQREVYWAIMAMSAVFMVAVRLPGGPRFRAATCLVLALAFLFGAGLAAYHAGAEWKWWPGPESCSGASTAVSADALKNLLAGGSVKAPACDKAAWVFLGLSMAGWNALASVGFALLSVAAALRERRKP